MRLPAQSKLALQDTYPLQCDGGYVSSYSASLKKALKEWEERRGLTSTMRQWKNNPLFARSKPTTREEVAWNKAPRTAKPKMSEAERLEKRRIYMQTIRKTETVEEKVERLKLRRAAYLAKIGGKLKIAGKLTSEERILSQKAAQQRYKERRKLGLVAARKKQPKRPLTAEQKAKKAAKQRELYARTRNHTAK
jgi:hypothetical protein